MINENKLHFPLSLLYNMYISIARFVKKNLFKLFLVYNLLLKGELREKILKQSKLTIAIFISLVLGILFGWLFPQFAVKTHVLAEVFLRMVKMIIAPLLFATLVVGIAGHGDVKSLGRLGIKTVVYFEVVTTFALIIGLGFANLFKPGEGMVDIASRHIALGEIVNMTNSVQHNSFGEMF